MIRTEKRDVNDDSKLREKLSKLFREQGHKQSMTEGSGKMKLSTGGLKSTSPKNGLQNGIASHKQARATNNLKRENNLENVIGGHQMTTRKPQVSQNNKNNAGKTAYKTSAEKRNRQASESTNTVKSNKNKPLPHFTTKAESVSKGQTQPNSKNKTTKKGGKPSNNIQPHVIELKFNNKQTVEAENPTSFKRKREVDAKSAKPTPKTQQQDTKSQAKSAPVLNGKNKSVSRENPHSSNRKKPIEANQKKGNVKNLNPTSKPGSAPQPNTNGKVKLQAKRAAPPKQLNQHHKQARLELQSHVNSFKEHTNEDLSDSESDFDSDFMASNGYEYDDDNDEFNCDFSDDEDDEDYSSVEHDDYESYTGSEDDQLIYSDDGEDNYETDSSNSFYDDDDDSHDAFDEDYKLPEHVPEDLIIHQGTAIKYPIPKGEPVLLDSDNDESHLVEIRQSKIVCVKQPVEYSIEALNKLNELFAKIEINSFQTILEKKSTSTSTEGSYNSPCPDLVSAEYEDAESDVSFDERYEKMSDDASIVSDINEKYTTVESNSSDSDMSEYADDKMYSKDDIKIGVSDATTLPLAAAPCFCDLPSNSSGHDIDVDAQTYDTHDATVGEVFPVSYTDRALEDTASPSSGTSLKSTSCDDSEILKSPNELSNSVEESVFIDELILKTASEKTTSRNVFFNAINCNDVIVLLKDPFYIYGTLRLTLLSGCVDVFGHIPIVDKIYEIYSPRGCSMIQVTPQRSAQAVKQSLSAALAGHYKTFLKAELDSICEQYVPGQDAVLLLQRNFGAKKIIGNFRKFMSENVFPNLKTVPTDRSNYNSEYLLQCVINEDCDKGVKVSPDWQRLKLSRQTKMMLTGGKSVGKSTLLRYLANSNLKQFPKILLIDLDIGQPEVFVPQTVSCTVMTEPLLGPGFFLLRQPDKAYMVGHVNIAYCAETYMRAVKKLLEYCYSQPEYANIPWLINTMGYNKGFGLELIACVVNYLQPTDIVQLQSNRNINNFDAPLDSESLTAEPRIIFGAEEFKPSRATSNHRLHLLNSVVLRESRHHKEWNMSPSDLRYAMILTRLSAALRETDEWLTDCKPLCTSFDELHFVNMLNRQDSREVLIGAVEANLVYLCKLDEGSPTLECFGIGVVRAIDYIMNQLYLLPATLYSTVAQVNCLALGEIPLPNSLFLNQGPKLCGMVPFVSSTNDANASKAIKQIYHRPPEFLTGAHREL